MVLAAQAVVAPDVYVNCQYRVAAIFPGQPVIRDITYANGGRTVPARQFYVERGMDRFSVTVADFTNGPAIDDQIVENAAAAFRQRGEVRLQYPEDYSPGIPGRQLNVFDPSGRQYLGSVYMADHRLYMTETYAAPGDFAALQFEQSVLLIDGNGATSTMSMQQPETVMPARHSRPLLRTPAIWSGRLLRPKVAPRRCAG